MALDVFISYTHADRAFRDKLSKHLSGLRNNGVINDWFDGDIVVGTEWDPEITGRLNSAQIILLLISDEFLASSFCYHIEMKRAMERHDADEARVIPIILRPCDWKKAPFGKIQAAPESGKPITRWSNRDEAYVDIVRKIKGAIHRLEEHPLQPVDESAENKQPDPPKEQGKKSPTQSASRRALSGKDGGTTKNSIGSIGGNNNTINQGGTIHTTVTNQYGKPKE